MIKRGRAATGFYSATGGTSAIRVEFFVRVHRCYLANLNEVEKYVKGEGGYLVMSDGTSIDVARNKKEVLMKKLLPYKT